MTDANTLAFPITPEIWGTHPDFHGMTLRDYFAAASMAPVVALCIEAVKSGSGSGTIDEATMARQAYLFADALLAARKGPDHGRG